MELVTKLTNGIVVDRSKLIKLKADELAKTMANIYSDPTANVVIIDNTTTFFSDEALYEAIKTNSLNLALIAEQRGIELLAEDLFIITKFRELNEKVAATLLANIPPLPLYAFEAVPNGWDINIDLEITANRVKRKNGSYFISIKQLERIWAVAGTYWHKDGQSLTGTINNIRANGDCRTGAVYTKKEAAQAGRGGGRAGVKVGCQYINRYELEQLALKFGWAFPTEA